MNLDLTSLSKSIQAFEKSLTVMNSISMDQNLDLWETVRAGVIQNFEVAYEQCWKFIQRWIHLNRTPEDADHPRTRKELFRFAARYGLISNPIQWFEFGEGRNLTSHTYDQEQADKVYELASCFLPYALELLKNLEKAND
jgi:nucleotidyltransferase substrate binding protein (TIGR01987 family)